MNTEEDQLFLSKKLSKFARDQEEKEEEKKEEQPVE